MRVNQTGFTGGIMTKVLIKEKRRKTPAISSAKMTDWISLKEGAKLFFVSIDWIRNQINRGRLRSFKSKNRRFVHGPSLSNLVNDPGLPPPNRKRKRESKS